MGIILDVKLEEVLNSDVFALSNILFLFNQHVLRIFGENFAGRSFKLPNYNFCWHNFEHQVSNWHLNYLNNTLNVIPSYAVYVELI